ncbi:MAG: hypothetical protein KDA96_07570 [Planctomycetaceae bacterium]|nr:hypothetical protein [Planctomycetaceae bacterium]
MATERTRTSDLDPAEGTPGGNSDSANCPQLDEIREWMLQLADFGHPHFGEFASRLAAVREILLNQIQTKETSKDPGLDYSRTRGCHEDIASSNGVVQSADQLADTVQEHFERESFCHTLDNFISALRGESRCFVSWQAACRVFEHLCEEFQRLTCDKDTDS